MKTLSSVSTVAIETGIVDAQAVAEAKRFGLPLFEEISVIEGQSAQDIVERLEEARDNALPLRTTELDALHLYTHNAKEGTLYLEDDDGESTSLRITYARTTRGEYMFGWRAETISHLMCNGKTHLSSDTEQGDIYFTDIQELYFGELKAFMVCTPWVGHAAGKDAP